MSGIAYDRKGNIFLQLENGEGKEYYNKNEQLQFEGQYNNGRRWNGKGYDFEGNKVFEIQSGKGSGKIYDFYGYLIFEGEYLNGERNGKGIEYYYTRKKNTICW